MYILRLVEVTLLPNGTAGCVYDVKDRMEGMWNVESCGVEGSFSYYTELSSPFELVLLVCTTINDYALAKVH